MLSPAQLISLVNAHPALSQIYAHVIVGGSADAAHDMGHNLRVAIWTLHIGGSEIDQTEGICAALLHDLDAGKKTQENRRDAAARSALASAELMRRFGIEDGSANRVAEAIRTHSFSADLPPTSLLGAALQDADMLDALGAIGIMRNVAVGASLKSQLFDLFDPWGMERELDDQRIVLDHFPKKLLLLPGRMNTKAGRREALVRLSAMKAFYESLGREIGSSMSVSWSEKIDVVLAAEWAGDQSV